ncbi:hypothetical protein Tco_1330660, partial [Tanacetum coccineum]
GKDCGFDLNEDEVVSKVDDVSLVDGVFEGAFGVDGDEDFVIREGIRGGGLGRSHRDGSIEKIVNCTENQENTVKILVTPGGGPLNKGAVPDIYEGRQPTLFPQESSKISKFANS